MSRVGQWRRYRKEFGHSYSFGVFPTLELLTHRPESVRQVVAHSSGARSSGWGKLESLCAAHAVPFVVDDRAVERLTHKGNVYVFGVFAKYDAPLSATADHLLLVQPSDHGNLGTIARTLLAFGTRDVALIAPAVDIFNPHVVRASMGAIFALRFGYFNHFEAYRTAFNQPDRTLYPFMLGAPTPLAEVTFHHPHTLVFGPEGAGLPPEYAEVGVPVTIPQSSLVESLNLAVTVGIALYGVVRMKPQGL